MQGNEAIKSKKDSNWVGQSTGRFAKTERQLNWAKERTSKTAFGLRTHCQISFLAVDASLNGFRAMNVLFWATGVSFRHVRDGPFPLLSKVQPITSAQPF